VFPGLGLCAVAIFTCTAIAAQQSTTQDIAEAARQERARKEAQQKKPKHVYTEEDLKRAQILTPEDRAELQAKKNGESSDADKTQEALDSLPLSPNADAPLLPNNFPAPFSPDTPLGDVARNYRRWKTSQALRREQQFPLSLPKAPVLASPKGMQPILAPLSPAEPVPPHLDSSQPFAHPTRRSRPPIKAEAPQFTPFQPPVKRSPFARPKFFNADPPRVLSSRPVPPGLSTQPPAAPAAPAKPSKSLGLDNRSRPAVPVKPSKPLTQVNPPALMAPSKSAIPPASTGPSKPIAAIRPSKPFIFTNPSARVAQPKPSKPSAKINPPAFEAVITPTKPLSSAAPSAPTVAEEPSKPFVFGNPSKPIPPSKPFAPLARVSPPAFAAPLSPPKPLPSVVPIAPASAARVMPLAASPPSVAPTNSAALIVQPGDSLWKLAAKHLGGGPRWREFLAVNPSIHDANHIAVGSQIVVPPAAYPSRKLQTLIVQQGDTLWGIAKARFGRASAWACIAHANPSIVDGDLIYAGQTLVLPASCNP